MTTNQRKRQMIIDMKRAKKDHDLTIAQLVELVENDGGVVSESTMKAVFAKGSEDASPITFKLESTLFPIQRALLKTYGDKLSVDDVSALKGFIVNKNETIALLFAEIEKKDEEIKTLREKIKRQEEVIDRKDLIIESKDKRIEHKDDIIAEYLNKIIKE